MLKQELSTFYAQEIDNLDRTFNLHSSICLLYKNMTYQQDFVFLIIVIYL
jgi:hypothetical protein